MNAIVMRGVLVGALAGLLFGFDTAVIAGVTGGLRSAYQLSPGGLGFTVSSALWGTLAGALLAGAPGDRFGARFCLKAIAILYVASSLGCALAWDWPSLLFFRVLAGIAIGASTVLAPVYMTEISPPNWRGAMVGMFQFNITLGILVAYLSNYLIGILQLGTAEWRWKFAVAFLPGLILFLFLFTIPQSPRWLALKGRLAEAREILHRIMPRITQAEEESHFPSDARRRQTAPELDKAPQTHSAGGRDRRLQPIGRHQCHSLLHQRYFRGRGLQQDLRRSAIDHDRRHKSPVHHSCALC